MPWRPSEEKRFLLVASSADRSRLGASRRARRASAPVAGARRCSHRKPPAPQPGRGSEVLGAIATPPALDRRSSAAVVCPRNPHNRWQHAAWRVGRSAGRPRRTTDDRKASARATPGAWAAARSPALPAVRAPPVLREVEVVDRRAEERLAHVVHGLGERVGHPIQAPAGRPQHERKMQAVVVGRRGRRVLRRGRS